MVAVRKHSSAEALGYFQSRYPQPLGMFSAGQFVLCAALFVFACPVFVLTRSLIVLKRPVIVFARSVFVFAPPLIFEYSSGAAGMSQRRSFLFYSQCREPDACLGCLGGVSYSTFYRIK
jgi:hypothetical protein